MGRRLRRALGGRWQRAGRWSCRSERMRPALIPSLCNDEPFRQGGAQTVRGPVYFQTIQFFFCTIQTYKSHASKVMGFRQRSERKGKRGTKNVTRAQQRAREEGDWGRCPPPAEERRQSGPAPEKMTLCEGRRGGSAQGGGRSGK